MSSNHPTKKKQSKRDRRMKLAVYIMIIAMLLTSITAGIGSIL